MSYQIIKSILFDFTDYVHNGVTIDDIDEILDEIYKKYKKCSIKPISGVLMYEIKTLLTKDEELDIIGNEITNKLDIRLVERSEDEAIKYNRGN